MPKSGPLHHGLLAVLRDSLSDSLIQAQQLRATSESLLAQAENANYAASELRTNLQFQVQVLRAAEEQFTDNIWRADGGCTFFDVIMFVCAVVAIATGAYLAAAAAIKAATDSESKDDTIKRLQTVRTEVVGFSAQVAEAKRLYSKINPQTEIFSVTNKLLLDEALLDQMIQPYLTGDNNNS